MQSTTPKLQNPEPPQSTKLGVLEENFQIQAKNQQCTRTHKQKSKPSVSTCRVTWKNEEIEWKTARMSWQVTDVRSHPTTSPLHTCSTPNLGRDLHIKQEIKTTQNSKLNISKQSQQININSSSSAQPPVLPTPRFLSDTQYKLHNLLPQCFESYRCKTWPVSLNSLNVF